MIDNSAEIQPNNPLKEQISAFVDGEVQFNELDRVLQQLQTETARQDWLLYHQIGDLINSDDLSMTLSDNFAPALRAKLASEPVFIQPGARVPTFFSRKMAYAAACIAALVMVMMPEFAGNDATQSRRPFSSNLLASAAQGMQTGATMASSASADHVISAPLQRPATPPEMLRDPDIDDYLAAHQRYSKSMYSAVEYQTHPIIQEPDR